LKRKIAIFTGNRSDYGLQLPVLKAIAGHPQLEHYLLVSGAHLKADFGHTLQEIESDGFEIYAQVQIDMLEDSLFSTAQAIGSGVIAVSNILANLAPDFLVVYGDRFETFAATIASTQMGIPTAHIEGGDRTEGGALDDSVRHAMTKLAHLHFTTNEQASDRVRQMGEEPWRIHNVGLPVLDLVAQGQFASPEEVYGRLRLSPSRPLLVFTQHSVATEFDQAGEQVRPSLEALGDACREWDCQAVVTYPSDDAGGRRILEEIDRLQAANPPDTQVVPSLGRHLYHGILNVAAACIGNSSSGIKETPAFHIPCVNIGDRQRGRLRSTNVIDVGYDRMAIKSAIGRCLHDDEFLAGVRQCTNPYGSGKAGSAIAAVLATIDINPALVQKKMTY
jgi:UDP-hydrolysing UDP-N-acetyl-D-glucosamine 2-epimerase